MSGQVKAGLLSGFFIREHHIYTEVHLRWVPQRGSLHTEIGRSTIIFESSSSPDNYEICVSRGESQHVNLDIAVGCENLPFEN